MMTPATVIINGWTIYAHPLFLDQLDALIGHVELAKLKDPVGYQTKRVAKQLAAVLKVAFDDIPGDPTRSVYRQGDTLGPAHKHWFRAKFLQQYRLFFRYQQSQRTKVIVLAWVNDDDSLRAYDSKTDAYATFRKMIESGHPPDGWEDLLTSASSAASVRRLNKTRVP